jgi:hypothetical protein
MSLKGVDMQADLELTPAQKELFKPGCFVMLHPESQHPDAGRVGKIISRHSNNIVVEFFTDDLLEQSEYSIIPLRHWAPVPEFFVEEYEPRFKKRGWRVTERGLKMFHHLSWGYTLATVGKDHV